MNKYTKKLNYSYSLGVCPTIELLKSHPSQVKSVILSSKSSANQGVKKITQICKQAKIKVEYQDHKIRQLSNKQNCLAVGVFDKYPSQLSTQENHLVLASIRNRGNLGTILRTALGFNFRNLVLIRPAVDIFDPQVIRSSMGALFSLNHVYFDNLKSYLASFPDHHPYAFITRSQQLLPQTNFTSPYSLIFGNESSGLLPHQQQLATPLTIPQTSQTDSLNLAVSVGIVLYSLYVKNHH